LSGWLVAAMVLLAGSQLHALFWPLSVGSALTATFLLHFAAGTTTILGGIVELRRIAAERGRLLTVGQEHLRRMRELAVLKADFTAMVAHELASPLAAIRGHADMFDAAAHARILLGAHPVITKISARGRVLADADRIGQVLRNLLDNAATYSSEGAPIELRALSAGTTNEAAERVRIEVADRGPGIRLDDVGRIFEKLGRGETDKVAVGTGLGLYLSMRIVRAHGSELTVDSTPGKGSVFAFNLDTA
jgi:signal transduction histidine kinase